MCNVISCPICLSVIPTELLVKLSQCDCGFCKLCLAVYVTTLISELLDTDFPCPGLQCNGHLTADEIKSLVNPSLYERYENQALQRKVQSNPSITFCSAVGCGAVCSVPTDSTDPHNSQCDPLRPSSLLRNLCSWRPNFTRPVKQQSFVTETALRNPQPAQITCSVCGYAFCARCKLAWHPTNPNACQSPPTFQPFGIRFLRKKRHKSTPTNTVESSPIKTNQKSVNELSSTHGTLRDPLISVHTDTQSHSDISASRTTSTASRGNRLGLCFRTGLRFPSKQMGSSVAADTSVLGVGFPPYPADAWLKRCPTCLVPIERIEGCAQMMCRSCKHTFCWYCLTSLDGDFLLHHYDRGDCKGKLGHSRASVLGHRIYVVGAFTGMSLLLLIASPFVVISLPCILCARCHHLYRRQVLRRHHVAGIFPTNQNVSSSSASSGVLRPTPNVSCEQSSQKVLENVIPEGIHLAETVDIHWSLSRFSDGVNS